MAMDPSVNQVVIDMRGIITMTTQCVKAIFVRLYQELGYSIYYQNILFENKSDTVNTPHKIVVMPKTRITEKSINMPVVEGLETNRLFYEI